MPIRCMLSSTNGHWSCCQGQEGIPYDVGHPYSCQQLLAIIAAGITHQAVVATGFMALLLSRQWQ